MVGFGYYLIHLRGNYLGFVDVCVMEREKYNSIDVAWLLVGRANEMGISMNITKAQKLLYVVYGVGLVAYNRQFLNESPKAWPYGPVFPKTRKALIRINLNSLGVEDCDERLQNDTELQSAITVVLRSFGNKTAGWLTEWTHLNGSPWWKVVHQDKEKWNAPIPDEYISHYFSGIVNIKSTSNEE